MGIISTEAGGEKSPQPASDPRGQWKQELLAKKQDTGEKPGDSVAIETEASASLQKQKWPAVFAEMAHKMNTKKWPLSQVSQPRERSYKKRPEGTLWRLGERPLWAQTGLSVYTDIRIYTQISVYIHAQIQMCVYTWVSTYTLPQLWQLRDDRDPSGAMTMLSAQVLVSNATLHQRNQGYLQRG